jgi:DNA polymerase-3 subunit gamma/tau
MSESLINRYRPQDFDSVIGHKQVLRTIQNTIANNLAHSFIFCGDPGVGKTTLARIIAKKVGCKKPVEIDGASATGIEAMREITSTLGYKSMNGEAKVIIVDEAHRLSSAAITSLLKAIEEPQAHVYWVLATTELNKIPKAIQTRCQVYNLGPIPDEEISKLLETVSREEGFSTSPEVREFITDQASGSARHALSLLASCSSVTSLSDAKKLITSSSEERSVIDLARYLVQDHNPSWKAIQNHLSGLTKESPEGIRLTIVNYVAKVILNTKQSSEAARLLNILNAFRTPYNTSEKFSPLILSLGEIVFHERIQQ